MKKKEILLQLRRIALRETYTIGKLSIHGVYFCDTLEDKVRDLNKDGDLDDPGEGKVYAETAIPYGTYEVVVNESPKFKRKLPRLMNVRHFTGILIHRGVHAGHSAGCILVGKNTEVGKLSNGKRYEELLTAKLLVFQEQGYGIYIEIV